MKVVLPVTVLVVVGWLLRRSRPDLGSFVLVFHNPVFIRELLAGLRSARLRWILLLYLVVPFAVIAVSWPSNQVFYGGSDLALGVWNSYLFAQVWLVVLLTPIFAAYSVSSEFQQDTADLLWITRIPPAAIVLGKMAAVVLLCVGLLLASLASLSLLFYLGGVGADQILGGFVLLLCIVLFTSSVAVFYSARFRQGHRALVLTYVTLSLFPCLLGMMFGTVLTRGGFSAWAYAPALAICAVFVAAAAGSANQPVGENTRANFKPIDDPRQIRLRRRTWPYYLVDPMRRLAPMPEGGNIVAHHEPRVHPLHRSEWGYRCLAVTGSVTGVLLLWLIVDAFTGRNLEGFQMTYFLWWMNFVPAAIWTVMSHAVSLTLDQELGTLDSLRLTTIEPGQFLVGKWLGSLRMRRIMIAIGLIGVTGAQLASRADAAEVILLPLAWWFMVELCGWLAFAISSLCARTMSAVALSLAAATALVVGALWLMDASFDPDWEDRINRLLPFGGDAKLDIVKILILVLVGFASWLLARIGTRRLWTVEP